MRHVALFVEDLEACLTFYVGLLGMRVEWQPDDDNYYLTSGSDNVALHRSSSPAAESGQRLDHIGFIIETPTGVDEWHGHLAGSGIKILQPPKTHRDGARSFYCLDPAGTLVQFIYHPPISGSGDIKP